MLIHLTQIRDDTRPARLLDMVEGPSNSAFKTWLAARPKAWREVEDVVAMDTFTGFKTATVAELPDAVALMDAFHVVRLAGDALDRYRRWVQLDLHGNRDQAKVLLYNARQTLHTGPDLLTEEQQSRLEALFATDEHIEVEATWGIYQRMIAAYRRPARSQGRALMTAIIDFLTREVPTALPNWSVSGGL